MPFKPIRIVPGAAPAPWVDPFLDGGGGTSAAPTTGYELLLLIREWAQRQPDTNSKQSTVEVSRGDGATATVLVPQIVPVDNAWTRVDQPIARFVADRPYVAGTTGGGTINADSTYGVDPSGRFVDNWRGVAHNGSMWVVVGSGDKLAYSTDGVTWTRGSVIDEAGVSWVDVDDEGVTIRVGYQWEQVVWNGSVFCAIADAYRNTDFSYTLTTVCATSPDGINWTARNFGGAAKYTYHIAARGSMLVVGGVGHLRASSDNGVTWNYYSLGAYEVLALASSPTLICAVVKEGSYAFSYTSTNGTDWERNAFPNNIFSLAGIGWGDGKFVVVSNAGSPVKSYTSADGVTWAQHASLPSNIYQTVKWVGDRFLTLGYRNVVHSSADGITWIAASIKPDGGVYASSLSWTPFASDGSKVITVSTVGHVSTSTDSGDTWAGAIEASPTIEAVEVSQADMDAFNEARNPTDPYFFFADGLNPYLLEGMEAVIIEYPFIPPSEYVVGRFDRSGSFNRISYPIVDYVIFTFDGRYYNPTTGIWQQGTDAGCRVYYEPGNYKFYIAVEEMMRRTGHDYPVCFATGYDFNGQQVGVELVTAVTSDPTFVQIRVGAKVLNFNTGALQTAETWETWIKMPQWGLGYGESLTSYRMVSAADMPRTGPGQEPFRPPTITTTGITSGSDQIGDDGGYVATPYSPFQLQAAGGFTEIASPPVAGGLCLGGFSEPASPPQPFASRGGFLEAGSSVVLAQYASAATQHLGIPFTIEG